MHSLDNVLRAYNEIHEDEIENPENAVEYTI